MRSVSCRLAVGLVVLAVTAAGAAEGKKKASPGAAGYFESVRRQPPLLAVFLRQMPKGADLHSHLSGAVYAESYIAWAAEDGLCIDRAQMAFAACPTDDKPKLKAASALENPELYRDLLNALSMRDYHNGEESGYEHFFAAFTRFNAVSRRHTGDMLAEVAERAAAEHVLHLELMLTPASATDLGRQAGWDDNFDSLRRKVVEAGLPGVLARARKSLDTALARKDEVLHCGTPAARPGCATSLRFLYQGLRGVPREQAFAQLLAGFELASADSRVVGVNLVMAEDSYLSMKDFDLHMRMLDYLHHQYPKVHIALHAGELAPGLVPPEGLRDHIRESVELGHAERIGHGADIMYERDPLQLLREMARRKVLLEACLSSNDIILGVRGANHPLPLYLRYDVPVAIATDDAGVARSDLSREYQRAIESFGLRYDDVRRMVRLSLEHSFLPGQSLWSDIDRAQMTTACRTEAVRQPPRSEACNHLLENSEKARLQWRLEQQLAAFEAQY